MLPPLVFFLPPPTSFLPRLLFFFFYFSASSLSFLAFSSHSSSSSLLPLLLVLRLLLSPCSLNFLRLSSKLLDIADLSHLPPPTIMALHTRCRPPSIPLPVQPHQTTATHHRNPMLCHHQPPFRLNPHLRSHSRPNPLPCTMPSTDFLLHLPMPMPHPPPFVAFTSKQKEKKTAHHLESFSRPPCMWRTTAVLNPMLPPTPTPPMQSPVPPTPSHPCHTYAP